jgi:hypothetical protein
MATDEELEQSYSALSNEQKTLHDFIVGGTEALIEYHSQVKEAELTNQPAPPQPDAAKQILHFQSGVGMSSNNFLWTTDMDEQHLLDQRTSRRAKGVLGKVHHLIRMMRNICSADYFRSD